MAVRAVIAIERMRFLVNKTKRVSKRVSGVDDRSRSRHSGPSNSPGSTRANQTIYEPIHARRNLEPSFPGNTSLDTRKDPVGGPLVSNEQVTAIPLTNGYHGDDRRQPHVIGRTQPLTSVSLASESTVPYTTKTTRSVSPPRTSRSSPSTLRSSPRSSSGRYRPPMSPPVRDSDSEEREQDGLHSRSRHSSPRPLSDEHRTISPASSNTEPFPVENGDHSLSMYIQRLESLQNRLANASKGK